LNVYDTIINRLLGTGGEERYQTWPEKMVRDALAAPSQAIAAGNAPNPYKEGSEEWQDFESRRGAALPQALNMAALAGTGGLGGVGAEAGAALGAGPFLRPALKFNEKIYKAPMGGQHLDALPKEMIPEFNRLAMSGEDISHYDFGFMNHKGQFLNREKALDYAIKEGLIDPNSEAARAGVLTSTMDLMADSSKPGQAIKALEKPSQLNTPREPTLADMKNANVADVLLSTARDPQSIGMDWSPLSQRKTYEPLVKGYEDLPIAVRMNNGEHLIYDGRHRTVIDINSGADKKKMYVLNAKDYDPANAGRTPAKQTMSDDELLKQLKDDK